jgi:hypothetical protein
VPGRREKDNLSLELPLVLVEVGDSLHVEQNYFTTTMPFVPGLQAFG